MELFGFVVGVGSWGFCSALGSSRAPLAGWRSSEFESGLF